MGAAAELAFMARPDTTSFISNGGLGVLVTINCDYLTPVVM